MDNDSVVKRLGLTMQLRVWGNLRWEVSSAMLNCLFIVMSLQFYVPLAIQHGATNFQVGIMTAASPIGMLLSPIWASISENKRPLPIVIGTNLIARLCVLVPVFNPDPWSFVIASLGIHILLGAQSPAYANLMTRVYPSELRGRLMGYVRVTSSVLMIPSVFLIAYWINKYGSANPITVAGVTGFFSVLLLIGMKETIAPQSSNKRTTFKEQVQLLTNNRMLLFYFITTSMVGFGNMLSLPIYQIVQVNVLQLSTADIGYIRVCYYTLLLLGYLSAGYIVDKLSPRAAIIGAMSFYILVPLIYATNSNYPATLLATGFLGVADAMWEIACLSYVFRYAPGKETVVFGIHLLCMGVRGTLAPMISTTVINYVHLSTIFYSSVICVVTGLFLFYVQTTKVQKNRYT